MADTASILALMRHAADRLAEEEANVQAAFAEARARAEQTNAYDARSVEAQAWSYAVASTYAQTVLRMVAEFMTDAEGATPGDIVTLAKAAWDHTAGAEPTAPAYGFSADRRWVGDKTPDTMGAGWRRRGLGEVDA